MNVRKLFRFGLGGIVGACLAVSAGLVLLPYGKGLINHSYSLLFGPRPHVNANEVVLVYMDDDSFEKLKQPYVSPPWDRNLHAKLIDRLKADGAKAVVFDIVFSDPLTNNPGADQNLARAMKEFGKVIVAADYAKTASGVKEVKSKSIMPPFDLIAENVANLGTADLDTDDDFIVRKLNVGERDDQVFPMGWAAAELVGANVTKIQEPEKRFAERWINYYGPPGHLPSISYYKAISDYRAVTGETDALESGFFRDKVVYVGSRLLTFGAGERKDEYRSPHYLLQSKSSESLFMAGVEVQATTFLNLLRGDWLTRLPKMQEAMII